MAITHSAFLTQVRNYTEVDANVLTDQIIQDFIRSVELDIAGKVDYDDLRKYVTSTFTVGNRYVILPGDALVIRSVQIIDSNNIRTFLEKKEIQVLYLSLHQTIIQQELLSITLTGKIMYNKDL